MDLNHKIQQILKGKNISSSQFADEIGVTRSGISHILSGRNKPSLDLVQKMIARYPELGTAWILDTELVPDFIVENTDKNIDKNAKTNALGLKAKKNTSDREDTSKVTHKETVSPKAILVQPKEVVRVMLFFTDGTFQEYSPSSQFNSGV